MSTTEVTAATRAAFTSSEITLLDGESMKVWTSPALGPNESVVLKQTSSADPSVDEPVREKKGTAALSATRPTMRVHGPGVYRLEKSATSRATALYYDS